MRRLIPLAALAVVLAGCGGASAVSGGAASIVPSGATAFVALDTRLTASQWSAAETLLRRFPVQDALLEKLQALQPVLGREVDLVALGRALVLLTHPPDRTKLLAEAGGGVVSKEVAGWTALSPSKDALDALGGKTALASAPSYELATKSIPGGALVRAFASAGSPAQQLLGTLPGQEQVAVTPLRRGSFRRGIAAERFAWAAAWLVPDAHGLRLEAHAHVQPPPQSVLERSSLVQAPVLPFEARLVDEIPAGALAVADFTIAPSEFELADPATLPASLRSLFAEGPTLPSQLDQILGGESAIYVQRAHPLDATLVTQPPDLKAALENVASVARFLRTVPALRGLRLHTATLGGELVVSTTQRAIDDFRGAGAKLSSDPAFMAAEDAARLPANTTGFVYGGGSALGVLAPLLGIPVPATPEQGLLLYAERVGRDASSVLFLQTG